MLRAREAAVPSRLLNEPVTHIGHDYHPNAFVDELLKEFAGVWTFRSPRLNNATEDNRVDTVLKVKPRQDD